MNHTETESTLKPVLVVAPPYLVWQWASELMKISDTFCIHVYFSNVHKKPPVSAKVINRLTVKSLIFNGTAANLRIIIITSY